MVTSETREQKLPNPDELQAQEEPLAQRRNQIHADTTQIKQDALLQVLQDLPGTVKRWNR
jgi:hypothetical protein